MPYRLAIALYFELFFVCFSQRYVLYNSFKKNASVFLKKIKKSFFDNFSITFRKKWAFFEIFCENVNNVICALRQRVKVAKSNGL